MAPEFGDYRVALRAARLRLFRDTQWKHPYYWAAFVLYGG
ncbi:MAG: CHAT domain-containing protein [bacterium]